MKKICAIDYGKVRIGLALSDEKKMIAFPYKTLNFKQFSWSSFLELLNPLLPDIETFIVGLPLMLNGRDSDMTKQVRYFAEKLQEETKILVVLWDERLTSALADRYLKECSYNRKKRSRLKDPIAATFILQSYLDKKNICLPPIH